MTGTECAGWEGEPGQPRHEESCVPHIDVWSSSCCVDGES